MDEVKDVTDVDRLHIWAKILCPVIFERTHQGYGGIVLFEIYPDKRIGLVIFEEDVVVRHMLLYQVVFCDKSVHFAGANDISEIIHVLKHCHDLCRLYGVVEILAKPIFQIFGFAHVDYVALFVQHEIHAGIVGDVFEFQLEINHGYIIAQKTQ